MKDYTGVYSSLGCFCQAHNLADPDYDNIFSDIEEIEQLAGSEYEVLWLKDLSMELRVQIYENLFARYGVVFTRTDVDEDILVVKSEQVQVVKDVILGTVGIPI